MATTFDLAQALGPFLDPIAFAIVGGGTLTAVILRTETSDLQRALAAPWRLGMRAFSADPLLTQIGAFGRIAQRHGVMALDKSIIADADVAAAIAAIVDGAPAEEVAARLLHRRRARLERHLAAADMWTGMAEVAPAMGMVGTLIGLVRMFTSMTDPSAIGGAMAVALLATLYGAVLANLVAMPIATRLRRRARTEAFERARLVDPLVALAIREAPRRHEIAGSTVAA